MKKKLMAIILVVTLLISVCPALASADYSPPPTVYYTEYTAIGDSICAGFSQPDYNYDAVYDITLGIHNSPAGCYATLAGNALGSTVNNLGKCGCGTSDLLSILQDSTNQYYDLYQQYISSSDLITLEIGSNDMLFAVIRAIFGCINPDYANLTNDQIMALGAPFMTGEISLAGDFAAIIQELETLTGGELTDEQIAAIAAVLTDDSLTAILQKAYDTFYTDFPLVLDALHAINPDAELLVLNYYNPYAGTNFTYGGVPYNIGDVLQGFIDQMNDYSLSCAEARSLVYVDISDTPSNMPDPHPSAAGHQMIAGRIVDAVLNTVTATASTGGTISPSGDTTVKLHDSITFTLTPEDGFMINAFYVDGEKIDGSELTALPGGAYSYILSDITDDHTVDAAFIAKQAPKLSITGDAALDFGSVFPDYTAPDAQTVTIENTGVQTVNLSLPTSANFTFALAATKLDPGESTTLTVQPKAGLSLGDYGKTVSVSGIGEYGSGSAAAALELSFAVIGHTYLVSGTPTTLDLGSIVEGYTTAPDPKTIAITNDGNTAVTLTLPTSDHFLFTLSDLTVDPGETVQLTVQPKLSLAWAKYDETVVLQGSNGASASFIIKLTVEEAYKYVTKTDTATGITVSGLMKSDAQLTVGALTLGTDAGSNAILLMKESKSYIFITGCDIKLTGDVKGSFTVTIPVGTKYDGQTVTILHASSGGLKTYSATVKSGIATIAVTDFSPFAVFVKAPSDNSPGTGDTHSSLGWFLLAGGSLLGAAAVAAVVTHRRKKD